MDKAEQGGRELPSGEKIMDTIQLPSKAPSLSENTGKVID